MTAVSYALGTPRPAASRGGDCYAHDLSTGRPITEGPHVHGPHRFAAPEHCVIQNGLLRLAVGAAGAAPSLAVSVRQGRTTVGDVFVDTFTDTFGGSTTVAAWVTIGTLTIDSPSVSALLTAVRLVEVVAWKWTIIQLVAPLMADAFVTLRAGERMVHVQHGDPRATPVDIDRRVRLTASPSPAGAGYGTRVQEDVAALTGLFRWVAAIDPATTNAGAFSLTATSVTSARFGAGAGTSELLDTPASQHAQLGNASRPVLVVA